MITTKNITFLSAQFITTQFITFQVHWLFWCMLSLIMGIIWCSKALSFTSAFIYVALLWLGLLVLIMYKIISWKALRIYLLIGTSFFIGAARYYTINYQQQQFNALVSNKSLTCMGKVISYEQVNEKYFSWCLTLKITAMKINQKNDTNFLHNIIKIYATKDQNINVGDSIEVADIIIKPCTNTGYSFYLLKEGIAATVFQPNLKFRIIYRPAYCLTRFLDTIKKNLVDNIRKKMSENTRALFFSIFLGLKPFNNRAFETIKEQFNYWGIVHYLARSGLHVIFIILILNIFLRFVPCRFIIKQSGMLILMGVYYLLSWSSISFVRACLTFLLYKCCVMSKVNHNVLHTITIVCFLVMAFNPCQLFFLDFQLSFALTFALAWFNELKLTIKKDQKLKTIEHKVMITLK